MCSKRHDSLEAGWDFELDGASLQAREKVANLTQALEAERIALEAEKVLHQGGFDVRVSSGEMCVHRGVCKLFLHTATSEFGMYA